MENAFFNLGRSGEFAAIKVKKERSSWKGAGMARAKRSSSNPLNKTEDKILQPIQRVDPSLIPISRVLFPTNGTVSSTVTCLQSLINQLKCHPADREVVYIGISKEYWLQAELNLGEPNGGCLTVSDLIRTLSQSIKAIHEHPRTHEVHRVSVDKNGQIKLG